MSYRAPAQWTEVRYGRRARRARGTFDQAWSGDRLRTRSGGRARASPVRRIVGSGTDLLPNPPVLPFGFSAPARSRRPPPGQGRQARSYADVVRQAAPRQFRGRGYSPRHYGGADQRRQDFRTAKTRQVPPPNPKFSSQDVLDHAAALIMSCGKAEGGRAEEGDRVVEDLQRGEDRPVRGRGAVLPESQARFLDEIVDLSSEPQASAVRRELLHHGEDDYTCIGC
ncbi:hypothetical protein Q5P01_003170 [Channa striata]|uniref:Uncharacterized protein n=1 Tax=Channa striata TaxID=64152 RepID=A0AA88NRU0_CHASR|nr:hypothetical protein Q5P01_003170 [Channa striata]